MKNLKFVIKNALNYLAQEISYYLNKPFCLPLIVHFLPTLRCNLKCKYCSIWKEGDIKKELDLKQWKKFLKELRDWAGKAHIGIPGGEPLLRKDIIDLLDYMCRLKLKPSLTTNGILLNDEIINKLSQLNIFNINISLESTNKNIHDFFRGEGSFEKTFNNILKLKEALKKNNSKTLLIIETTLNSKNLSSIKDLLEFCEKNDFKIVFCNIVENLQIDYRGNFKSESEYKPEDKRKIDEVFSFLIKNRKKTIINSTAVLKLTRDYYKNKKINFKCFANVNSLFITHDGSVKLCQYLPPVGNIKEKGIKEIWRSKEANNQRKIIKKCKKICQFNCYKKRSLFEYYQTYRTLYS